jgi:hypothetical protein
MVSKIGVILLTPIAIRNSRKPKSGIRRTSRQIECAETGYDAGAKRLRTEKKRRRRRRKRERKRKRMRERKRKRKRRAEDH